MMNVQMSSDITEFEPRLLFGLTKRQLICAGIAFGVGSLLFNVISTFDLSLTTRVCVTVILCFPILCVGWVKPFNMPLEKFFIKCFLPLKMNPSKKYYKTVGLYDFPESEKLYRETPIKKMKKKEKIEYDEMMEKYKGKN